MAVALPPIPSPSPPPPTRAPLLDRGGVIVLGKATIAGGPTDSIEGLPEGDGTYGGDDDADNSGVMQYVRIRTVARHWSGYRSTSHRRRPGTTLDHIDIAHNLDDGIEFFGGTVNVKYLSVVFSGDDAIDTDQGYQGKIQFAFVIADRDGHTVPRWTARSARRLARSLNCTMLCLSDPCRTIQTLCPRMMCTGDDAPLKNTAVSLATSSWST